MNGKKLNIGALIAAVLAAAATAIGAAAQAGKTDLLSLGKAAAIGAVGGAVGFFFPTWKTPGGPASDAQ